MKLTQVHEEESSRSIIQCRFLQLVFHTMEPHVVWAALMLMCEHFWRGKWQTNHGFPEEWGQHQFIVYSVCFSQVGRSVSAAFSKCSNFHQYTKSGNAAISNIFARFIPSVFSKMIRHTSRSSRPRHADSSFIE